MINTAISPSQAQHINVTLTLAEPPKSCINSPIVANETQSTNAKTRVSAASRFEEMPQSAMIPSQKLSNARIVLVTASVVCASICAAAAIVYFNGENIVPNIQNPIIPSPTPIITKNTTQSITTDTCPASIIYENATQSITTYTPLASIIHENTNDLTSITKLKPNQTVTSYRSVSVLDIHSLNFCKLSEAPFNLSLNRSRELVSPLSFQENHAVTVLNQGSSTYENIQLISEQLKPVAQSFAKIMNWFGKSVSNILTELVTESSRISTSLSDSKTPRSSTDVLQITDGSDSPSNIHSVALQPSILTVQNDKTPAEQTSTPTIINIKESDDRKSIFVGFNDNLNNQQLSEIIRIVSEKLQHISVASTTTQLDVIGQHPDQLVASNNPLTTERSKNYCIISKDETPTIGMDSQAIEAGQSLGSNEPALLNQANDLVTSEELSSNGKILQIFGNAVCFMDSSSNLQLTNPAMALSV